MSLVISVRGKDTNLKSLPSLGDEKQSAKS